MRRSTSLLHLLLFTIALAPLSLCGRSGVKLEHSNLVSHTETQLGDFKHEESESTSFSILLTDVVALVLKNKESQFFILDKNPEAKAHHLPVHIASHDSDEKGFEKKFTRAHSDIVSSKGVACILFDDIFEKKFEELHKLSVICQEKESPKNTIVL